MTELIMGLTYAAISFIMLLMLVAVLGKSAEYFSKYKDIK